jgi:hypothetical protein
MEMGVGRRVVSVMSLNAFTVEARDSRLSLGIEGLVDKLRAPESLHRLVMLAKPATTSVGDFCLKAMFDGVLMDAIMRSDYRAAYTTLVTLLGPDVTDQHPEVTVGTSPHADVTKRYAKAGARS